MRRIWYSREYQILRIGRILPAKSDKKDGLRSLAPDRAANGPGSFRH